VWAGASRVAVALALLAACNEPLAPPSKGNKGSAPISPSIPETGSDPISPPTDAAVAILTDADVAPPVDAAPPAKPLYAVADALADAKASPLKRIGIGEWPGNFSIKGCIYRNDRVFVVDVYCTYKEQPAFSTVIISPEKGEVRIYAEADSAISKLTRKDYFTFYAEGYPVLEELPAPPLATAKFDEVTAWQQKLYDSRIKLAGMSACSTGMASCDQDPAWDDTATEFIAGPNEDWTWIIDQLRNRAQHRGNYVGKKDPK
jgi:hypothetical protein